MSEAQSNPLIQVCPSCAALIDVSEEDVFARIHCPECGTQMRARTQFKNFTLQAVLGVGGMGTVYRALDCNLNRVVALKLLRKEFSASETDVGKLEREAKITASINHPHVVKVFTFGNDHGQFYIAMELVDHGSLDQKMDAQGRVPELEALNIGIQIASGLEAAFGVGLIHRDVKPGNILFADPETAKIVDFGLALLAEEGAEARGEIWGTPYYVAPEKLDDRPEDFRSDIYSLGATLFHAIAGRAPFEAETASLVALKHLKNQPVSLQAFAPFAADETAYVVNRMLDKDPERRYQSYRDLIDHLRYAADTISANGGRDRRAAKRVVVESESTLAWMGWVTLGTIVTLILGLLIFLLYPKGPKGRGTRTPPTEVVHDATGPGPGSVTGKSKGSKGKSPEELAQLATKLRQGRAALLRGDTARALPLLGEVAEYTPTLVDRNWVRLELALCHLLKGDPEDARTVFADILASAPRQEDGAQSDLNAITQKTARLATSATAAPAGSVKQFDPTGPGALSLLILGFKDLYLGAGTEAAALFDAFLQTKPVAPYDWIAEYHPLARRTRTDLEKFTAIEPKIANEQEWTPELLAEIARIEKHFQGTSPSLARRLKETGEKISASLETRRKAEIKELVVQEREMLEGARVQFATLVVSFRFEEAEKSLAAITPKLSANTTKIDSLKKRAAWLVEFKQTLIADLAARPYNGPVHTTRNLVLKGIGGGDAQNVHATLPFGKALLPWTDLPHTELARIADHYATLQTGKEAARRLWTRGVFSFEMGAQEEAKRKLLEATQLDPARRDDLANFFAAGTPPS